MAKAKLAIKMAASESKDVAKAVERLREALISVLQIDDVTTISISDDNKLTINGGLDDFFIDTSADDDPELTLFDTPDTPGGEATSLNELSPLARAFLDHPELLAVIEERDHPLKDMDLSEMDTIFNGIYPDDTTEERCSLRRAYDDDRKHDFANVFDEIERYRTSLVDDILNQSGTDAGEIPEPADVE